ncbi:MAG: B12-binding domain-containing radical SAM protein [Lachnospiraceae bacterium]|nr:B12-binding domain-containing radical SAM protein [Lachnospiraceae bacterium]
MKILLTAINSKYIHSNYALRLLKAYAEQELAKSGAFDSTDSRRNLEIEIAEYTINNLQSQILADIYQRQPDCIMFSCYIWSWNYVQALCKELPKVLPETDLWLGGPEVSFDADKVLKEHLELTGVMIGEGEATFTELAQAYGTTGFTKNSIQNNNAPSENPIDFANIAGLCLPTGFTNTRPLLDMNDLPFVYNEENIHDFDHKIIYYESSRGCPFSCSYCLSSVDKNVRFGSNEKTAKELQFFLDHQIPQVKFVDRTFNCNHGHSEFVLQYLLDHDNGITNFHFEIAADILSEKELAIMEQMRPGLIQLEIGVQSTNEKTLEEIHRATSLEKIKSITERIHSFGNIHQHLDLIAGLPYENLESFKNSFNEVYAMKPDQFQLGFLKVLKGSYMAQKIAEYHLKYTDTAPYEVLSTEWLSYGDCLKLKKIEEMVDLFYNSGQFSYTLPVLEKLFETPYEMYEELSTFFEKKGFFINNPARVYRYNLLLDFALEFAPDQADLFKELLTFDMYLRENCKTRPSFATDLKPYYGITKDIARQFSENNRSFVEGLPKQSLQNKKDIAPAKEQCHVDLFSYSVWEADCPKSEEPQFVVFDYSNRNPLNHNASFFTCPAPSSSYEQPELQK